MQGIIAVFTQGAQPLPIVVDAITDVIMIALLVCAVVAVGFVVEFAFKTILKLFVKAEKISLIESYLTLPGVLFHECSHALFATLSGAHVTEMNLIPRAEPDGSMTLGYVTYETRGGKFARSIQSTLASIAPTIMGLIAMGAILMFAIPACENNGVLSLIWWYLFLCLILHSEMSAQDIKVAMSGLPFVCLGLFVIFLFFPLDIEWWIAAFQSIASGEGWNGIQERFQVLYAAFQTHDINTIMQAVSGIGDEATDIAQGAINEALNVTESATGIDTSNLDYDPAKSINDTLNLYTSEGEAGNPLQSITDATNSLYQR